MPAKIIPVIDGKNKTWPEVQAMMGGVTRQQAQAKYKKLSQLGPVTMQSLGQRFQSPEVRARKEANLSAYTEREILNHARTNGPTHTAMAYKLPREQVVAMLEKQDREIKAFYQRGK